MIEFPNFGQTGFPLSGFGFAFYNGQLSGSSFSASGQGEGGSGIFSATISGNSMTGTFSGTDILGAGASIQFSATLS